jgi:glucokinase-like ROK family protein
MRKATREQIKHHNNRLVLRTIFNHEHISRADIARKTRLTRTTVSDVVNDLINDGLVEEIGYGPSAGGSPPMLIHVVDNSRQIIGIDLANSEFNGVLMNLRGEIQKRFTIHIQEQNGSAALELVYQLVEWLKDAATAPLLGVGIGTPGLMDAENGIIRSAVNLDWQDLPLRDLLQERYQLPVYIANDSHVAALGEYTFGTHQHGANMVVIKAGRGTSAGIILSGKIFHGDNFGAGEIGHLVVEENGEKCRCGNHGCLETIVSTRAILTHAQQIAKKNPHSSIHKLAVHQPALSLIDVCTAIQAGDEEIRNLIIQAGEYLGMTLANFIVTLNPSHIFIAGPISIFEDLFLDSLKRQARSSALGKLADSTTIEYSSLGDDIVILGAGAIVLANELELV